MTREGKEIQSFLQNWRYTEKKIEELKESTTTMTIKVTARYSMTPTRSAGMTSSSVEDYCIRRQEKSKEIEKLTKKLKAYEQAIAVAGLNKPERKVILFLKEDLRVSDFARNEGIYISYAYKIKDKAISKIEKALKKAHYEFFSR